jgi:hypothetical protein
VTGAVVVAPLEPAAAPLEPEVAPLDGVLRCASPVAGSVFLLPGPYVLGGAAGLLSFGSVVIFPGVWARIILSASADACAAKGTAKAAATAMAMAVLSFISWSP